MNWEQKLPEYMFLDPEYGTAIDSKKYQLSLDNGKYQLNEKIFENASEPEEYLKNFYEFMQELQVRIYGSEVILE